MKHFSGSAISRYQVFTLVDGTFVVQWDDKRVQELLTGHYREFDYGSDFGHAVTDYELEQLKSAGRVEHFNRMYVWLYPLPETGRFGRLRVLGQGNRIRAYYLATAQPRSMVERIRGELQSLGLQGELSIKLRDDMVALLDGEGQPFRTLEEAENAQSRLLDQGSDIFSDLSVAFIDKSGKVTANRVLMDGENAKLNLDEIIASQSDTSQVAGRLVVLAVSQDDERKAFGELFVEMELEVKYATTGAETLQLLEDFPADLLVSEFQLPDMHVWQMLGKVKEIEGLRELPILVITDQTNFATTVARVEHLTRPVSIARLRHNVWVTLSHSSPKRHAP